MADAVDVIEAANDAANDATNEGVTFFSDRDEVLRLIAEVVALQYNQHSDIAANARAFGTRYELLLLTLNKYQEQPLLIAPALPQLLQPLVDTLLATTASLSAYKIAGGAPTDSGGTDGDRGAQVVAVEGKDDAYEYSALKLNHACKVIQLLCKVRGFKHVSKLLPHEVHQLETCLYALLQQATSDFESWETRYVLILWLNVLCLIPFDICALDSSIATLTSSGYAYNASEIRGSKLVVLILDSCVRYLQDSGPAREAAALCVSSLLTRPDMDGTLLGQYLVDAQPLLLRWREHGDDAKNVLSSDTFRLIGVLHSLCQIYKKGVRSVLLQHCSGVLSFLLHLAQQTSNQVVVRKLVTKLIQRLGMTYLPVRVCSWRYSRGNRSLEENIKGVSTAIAAAAAAEDDAEGGDDEDAVPDEIEDIIGHLLQALQDKDTIVRWSAAKGIGRITMRLPRALADDVVAGVLDGCSDYDNDPYWHGSCLALAELARRGLLLPERLHEVVPIIESAILYDVVRGSHSVGAHVRDASCYVCWAFARAYSASVMRPFVSSLADTMLVTAVYDREINCRRAASAAYQENVGRQGNVNFPDGIAVMAVADYFSLGNRSNAYLVIAPQIAEICGRGGSGGSVAAAFRNHLVSYKLCHWDGEVRVLAARAVARLVFADPAAMVEVLPVLVADCFSSSLAKRHGGLLGIAETLLALADGGWSALVPTALLLDVAAVVPRMDKQRLYRGKGGDLLRQASCQLLEHLARSGMAGIPVKERVSLVELLNENLKQPHESVQAAAARALRHVLHVFFGGSAAPSERLRKLTVLAYVDLLRSSANVACTRGAALALGALPINLLLHSEEGSGQSGLSSPMLVEVLSLLVDHCSLHKVYEGSPDSETRRNCVAAIADVLERLEEEAAARGGAGELQRLLSTRVLPALHVAGADYNIDKRGDTGSWSRVEAMRALERIACMCARVVSGPAAGAVFTAYGVGVASTTDCSQMVVPSPSSPEDRADRFVSVTFPVSSYGASCAAADGCAPTSNVIRISARQVRPVDCAGSSDEYALGAEEWAAAMGLLLKQMSEKLDSVRDVGGCVLARLVAGEHRGRHAVIMPEFSAIEACLHSAEGAGCVNWQKAEQVFPFVVRLLDCVSYRKSILNGLVTAVGGLTEAVVKASTRALLAHCLQRRGSGSALGDLLQQLLEIFRENSAYTAVLGGASAATLGGNRVLVPLLKTLETLLRHSVFDQLLGRSSDPRLPSELYSYVNYEMNNSTDVVKIRKCLDILILLLNSDIDDVRYRCMKSVAVLVGHKYPKVRKYASELLYTYALADPYFIGIRFSAEAPSAIKIGFVTTPEELEAANGVLLETNWEGESLSGVRERRLALCSFLGLQMQTRVRSAAARAVATGAQADELDDYATLVREAGY